MPKTSFAFDEKASLAINLTAFGAHLHELDSVLAAKFWPQLPILLSGAYSHSAILNNLLAATQASHEALDISVTVASAAPTTASSVPVPPASCSSPVTGWLLEGVAIEGFRGINNQSQPLDLKFRLDKINSISAVNGVGKSSVYDAIRYAISGRLPWLEDLPASECDGDYYLNRFNTSGKATITLKLVAEPTSERCAITVIRDDKGARTVTATPPCDAEAILGSLDREFVLLDGATFQKFICAKPLDRGRTFSGLLGLSSYSALRQALAAIANTRAFGNHFELTAHTQVRARAEKVASDARAAIAGDYAALVGESFTGLDRAASQAKCRQALAQIGPLASLCDGKEFQALACIEAVKVAEGGSKRERLGECIRERSVLAKLNSEGPKPSRAARLVSLATEREEVLAKTAGDTMLELFQAGAKALELPEWTDSTLCPLCDNKASHDLKAHLAAKLSQFDTLDQASKALAMEWSEAGWANVHELEVMLEPVPPARLISKLRERAEAGGISSDEAKNVITYLETLRTRAEQREKTLASEQATLERDLPQSLVEVTKKLEMARRLQENWRRLAEAEMAVNSEVTREKQVSRVKEFLDRALTSFAIAEGAISKARLAGVEPVFRSYFEKMCFFGVVPAVAKRADSEDLQIRLSQFHGLENLSPQALLAESSRNAFAISLYLAAASLYGGLPKFVVLDDVTSSFDAGHQNFLIELLRTTLARPGNPNGLQVILLSHDTMLEKLFNKHSNSGGWWHQRLEGAPQLAVLPQAGAVNKVRDKTISMLQAGQVDFAKEGVRQYLEYRLGDLISRLRIPVPVDVAFNDNKQLAQEFLAAIDAAVKLHQSAGSLVLEPSQVTGLNANLATIVGNFLSHWGTGQTLSFTGAALLGVMQSIDAYCDCFTFEPMPGAPRQFYKSLQQRQ